jgi:hypothetical protein
MTLALILSAALITSAPPGNAVDPAPVLVNAEARAVPASDPSCPDPEELLLGDTSLLNFFAPVEPICSTWCGDQRVFCCADPNETCNYTCAMQEVLCRTDCRLNN